MLHWSSDCATCLQIAEMTYTALIASVLITSCIEMSLPSHQYTYDSPGRRVPSL